jgi:hypothetical protein
MIKITSLKSFDAQAVHLNKSGEIASLDFSNPVNTSSVVIVENPTNGNAKEKVLISDLASDSNAVHTNVSDEYDKAVLKASVTGPDRILLEDSAGGTWIKSYSTIDGISLDVISDGTTYKKYLPSERTKLSGIAIGAEPTNPITVSAAMATIDVKALQDITSDGADIEDAVTKKHTQGTDTTLGTLTTDITLGGFLVKDSGSPVDDTDLTTKGAVNTLLSGKQDSLTNGVDSLSSGEVTQLSNIDSVTIDNTQWTAIGDTNLSDAISKRHTQGTDTTLGTLTDNITMGGFLAKGSGIPVDDNDLVTKTYTDSKVLDEDDFSSDSTTQAPSQQSTATYIAANSGPMARIPYVNINESDSPYSASFGEFITTDLDSATPLIINLPALVTTDDIGKSIRIFISRNNSSLTINPGGTDKIFNQSTFKTTAQYATFDLVLVAGTAPTWQATCTPHKIVAGDQTVVYPDDVVLMKIDSSNNDIVLTTGNTIGGGGAGLSLSGNSTTGFEVYTTGGNAYSTVKCPDGNTCQFKLIHSTSGEEWRLTNTATSSMFQLRPGPNPQTFVADYDTGKMAVGGTIVPPANSLFKIGDSTNTMPIYADNASAITGGLVAGELYRTSTGILMIVY